MSYQSGNNRLSNPCRGSTDLPWALSTYTVSCSRSIYCCGLNQHAEFGQLPFMITATTAPEASVISPIVTIAHCIPKTSAMTPAQSAPIA